MRVIVVLVFVAQLLMGLNGFAEAQENQSRINLRMRNYEAMVPTSEFLSRARMYCQQVLGGHWDESVYRCRIDIVSRVAERLATECSARGGTFQDGECRVPITSVPDARQRICERLGGERWCASGLSEVGDQPQPLPADAIDAIQLTTRGEIYFTHFAPGEAKLFVFRSAATSAMNYPTLATSIATESRYGDSQLIGLLARAGENCESPPFNPSDLLSVLRDLRRRWEAGQQDYLGRTEEGYYYAISNALVKNIWVREDAPSGTCWYLWAYNASPHRSFSSVRISFTGPQD